MSAPWLPMNPQALGTISVLALSQILLSCSRDETESSDLGYVGRDATTDEYVPPSPDAKDANFEAGLPIPDVEAPNGWHLWEHAPSDVAVFVPDDVSHVLPLPWEPCPFMPVGCERAAAPWAADSGWAFGGTFFVVRSEGDYLITIGRRTQKGWNEIVLFRNEHPVAAWRMKVGESMAHVFPRPGQDGLVALPLIRYQAFTSPIVYISSPETLIQDPARIERFGPPDAALMPMGIVDRSDRLLILLEETGRLTVRDLKTGTTYRPKTPGLPFSGVMTGPKPIGDETYYGEWGVKGSLWRWKTGGHEGSFTKLLGDETYAYNFPSTDGQWLAWLRGKDWLGTNQFAEIELWTAPIQPELEPRKLSDLPGTWLSDLSAGEGWVAWRPTFKEVHLFRMNDGEHRRFPMVDNLDWYGRGDGITICDGKVWIGGAPEGHGNNDATWLFRIDIDALSPVDEMGTEK